MFKFWTQTPLGGSPKVKFLIDDGIMCGRGAKLSTSKHVRFNSCDVYLYLQCFGQAVSAFCITDAFSVHLFLGHLAAWSGDVWSLPCRQDGSSVGPIYVR